MILFTFPLSITAKKKCLTSQAGSSSTVSTASVQAIVDHLRYQNHRQSTKLNYLGIWRNFNKFYLRLDRKPESWTQRLILYVGHLINENRKSSTIKSYISAVKSVLRAVGEQITDDELLLTALIRVCRLKNDNIQTRLPIGKDLLAVMLNKINSLYLATALFGNYVQSSFCNSLLRTLQGR